MAAFCLLIVVLKKINQYAFDMRNSDHGCVMIFVCILVTYYIVNYDHKVSKNNQQIFASTLLYLYATHRIFK